MSEPSVDVSIIVPLEGGPEQALRCFEGIAAQLDAPAHEVIVVDDASVGLESLLARLAGDVRVVRSERRLGFLPAAQLGARHARGETSVLIRQAAAPSPSWLAALTRGVRTPGTTLATSTTLQEPHGHPLEAWSLAVSTAALREASIPTVGESLAVAALALACGPPVAASDAAVSAPSARVGAARRAPGRPPALTIVIPTLDAAAERVRRCIAAVQSTTEDDHEIVIVDNGAPPQGFSSPVNAGLRAAQTPYVVVMNDDVEPLPGWWPPLRAALDRGAAVVFPLTVEGAMRRDFAAWCFGMTEQTVARFGHAPGQFFDPSLVVWYQDTDLLYRLRQAGCPPVLVDTARIRHGLSESVGTEDPELSAWIRSQVTADRERFIAKHPDAGLAGHQLAA